jgi:hypothetical protein
MKPPSIDPSPHFSQEQRSLSYDKRWTLLQFFFCWLACVITPICIGILQAFEFTDVVVQLGIVCDVFFCFEANHGFILIKLGRCLSYIYSRCIIRSQEASYDHKVTNSPFDNTAKRLDGGVLRRPRRLLVPLLRALLPLLAPLLAKSLGASDLLQAWLTAFRLVRGHHLVALCKTLRFKFTDLTILRNDTINRCFVTAVFTSIYASSLAAIWFYLSCLRTQQ